MGRGAAHSNIYIIYTPVPNLGVNRLAYKAHASFRRGKRKLKTGERMRLHFTTKIPNVKTIPIDERWSLFFNQVKLTTSPIFVYFTCRSQQFVLLFTHFQVALKMCFFGGDLQPSTLKAFRWTKLRLFKVLGGRWCSWFLSIFCWQMASSHCGVQLNFIPLKGESDLERHMEMCMISF